MYISDPTNNGRGALAFSPAPRQPSAAAPDEPNRLLRALPAGEYERLLRELKPVTLTLGQVLADPEEPVPYVYFPRTCVASVVNRTDGHAVEVGTIGNEGMVGLSAFLDADALPAETVIQVAGDALRMPAAAFRALVAEGVATEPALNRLLRRYTHAYLAQVAQTAACNRLHELERRCARWLLMTRDRVEGDVLPLTQEFLAYMLGSRRAGVTVACGALQRSGLIRYRRGRITVLDREGLEAAACPCYGVVRAYTERTLGSAVG